MSNDSGFTRTAQSAYLRQELRAPAEALREYTQHGLELSQTDTDPALEASFRVMRERAERLLAWLDQLESVTISHGSSVPEASLERLQGESGRVLRHDIRGAAAYLVGCAEDWLETLPGPRRAIYEETLAQILRAGRQMIDWLQWYRREPDESPLKAEEHWQATFAQLHKLARHRPSSTLSGRVLVVDDNPFGRDLLVRQLQKMGHQVDVATSGAAALARLHSDTEPTWDVWLLDVLMPGLSGPEVLL